MIEIEDKFEPLIEEVKKSAGGIEASYSNPPKGTYELAQEAIIEYLTEKTEDIPIDHYLKDIIIEKMSEKHRG